MKKIEDECIAKAEAYEERSACKQAEIAGLKGALAILEQEVAPCRHLVVSSVVSSILTTSFLQLVVPSKIAVAFGADANGILNVSAQDIPIGRSNRPPVPMQRVACRNPRMTA